MMNDINYYEVLTSSFTTPLLSTNQTINRSSSMIGGRSSGSGGGGGGFTHYLQLVYLPVLVVLGVCGNITCAIVFTTKSLRRLRSSAYLFTLALSDIFFALDLLPGWISSGLVKPFYPGAGLVCKIQTYVSFMAPFVHIWMVLAFTAERFLAINFPLKHMSHCTPNVSRFVIFIIVSPALIFYIYPAFFASEIDKRGQCRENPDHVRFLNSINIIDTIMTMFLPFIVVSILNILIIRKLFCSATFRQHVFANGSRYRCRRTSNWPIKTSTPASIPLSPTPVIVPQSSPLISYRSQHLGRPFQPVNNHRPLCIYRTFTNSSSSQLNLNGTGLIDQPVQTPVPPLPSLGTLRKQQQQQKRRTECSAQRHVLTEVRLTKMLLAISLTCLSLNFPSYYLRLMMFYERISSSTNKTDNQTETNESDFALYRDMLLHYMSYLSYSINLFIYILFGGNFRRALKRLCSMSSSPSTSSQHGMNSSNSNKKSRHRNLIEHDSNSLVYSTVTVCSSANSSLRSYSKSLKLREQDSLRRTLRQQQFLMSQQQHNERAM